MRLLIIAVFSLASTSLLAQTKKIAFKSHSGSDANFKIALDNNLFDMEASNFGLPAPKEVFTKSLDSVIYLSADMTLLITSNYSTKTFPKKEKPVFINMSRDTVYNSELFSNKHGLNNIKAALKAENKYSNPVEKIVFIGFDNKKNKKNKQETLLPVAINNNDNSNNDAINYSSNNIQYTAFTTPVIRMLLTILIFSILAGLVAWKYAQSKQRTASISAG